MSIQMLQRKYEALTGCTEETLEFFQEIIAMLEQLESRVNDVQYSGDGDGDGQ